MRNNSKLKQSAAAIHNKDLSEAISGGIACLIDGIDIDYSGLLPSKSEDFVERVVKDTKGNRIVNEPVHKFMHRFIRFAKKNGFTKYAIIGGFGLGKSLCKGSKVIMYDGSLKKVEDVIVGDLLMGPDSKPRKVLFLGCGKEKTYKITLENGECFFCNASHKMPMVNRENKVVIMPIGFYFDAACFGGGFRIQKMVTTENLSKYNGKNLFSFTVCEVDPIEYYGFGLDGDKLFLDEYFNIHHNTEQMCVGLSLYRIAQNPNTLIKMVHVSDTEAVKRCRAIRDYIERDEDFHELAPHVRPTNIWGSERFIVSRTAPSKDGTVEAYSVLGTGIGGRANLIIFDDPQDLRTAVYEPTTREKIKETINNIWLTRLIPDDQEVVLMMNKWHDSLVSGKTLTLDGMKDISEINKSDLVYTSNGFQKVLKTDKAPYHGKTYKIIPKYFSGFCSEYTADHEILTKDGWKYACDITKDDFLVVPIYHGNLDWKKEVLKNYPDEYEYKTKVVKNKPLINIEKEELEKLLSDGLTYEDISKKYGVAKTSIFNLCKYYGVNRERNNKLSKAIFYDIDFWRILGYWVAEGYITYSNKNTKNTTNVIVFTFGSHESDFIDDTINFFKKYNIDSCVYYTDRNSCVVKVSSEQLSFWLRSNFSVGSDKLRLPEWFFSLPKGQFFEFLKGYFLGDGCASDGYVRFSSVSDTLLYGIQLNLLRFGIISSLYKSSCSGVKKANFGFGETYINSKDSYELRIRKSPDKKLVYIEDDKLYTRVTKIVSRDYSGYVYDISTPTRDFCSGGYLVHNSDYGSFVQRNPSWAWMSIAVSECKNHLLYEDSFGRKYKLPLWSKFNKEALEKRHVELGTRDFNRGYRLIPYSDKDKTFSYFERCCHYGMSPRTVIDDESNWIFMAGIDFSSTKRPGTIISVVAAHKKTGLKIPVDIVAVRNASDITHHIVKFYREYGCSFVAENNGVQDAIIDLLESDLGSEKYKRYNIKISGFLTGKNKADNDVGLPSMDKEFENKEWMFFFNEKPELSDDFEKNVWSRLYYEMLNHPYFVTTDIVMSLWFARNGITKLIRGSGGPQIF